jgi:hypothetical protein
MTNRILVLEFPFFGHTLSPDSRLTGGIAKRDNFTYLVPVAETAFCHSRESGNPVFRL